MRDLTAKLLRYFFTGGLELAAIVDTRGFALLIMAKIAIAPAAATSFCVAAFVNFELTSRFVFKRDATGRGFALFLLAVLIGLIVNVGITLAGIAFLGCRHLPLRLLGSGPLSCSTSL
jgi:putative flippase GtrA